MVNLRIKEHQRDVWLKTSQLALSEHKSKQNIKYLPKTPTIANIILYFPKKYREATEIQKHPNHLNRDTGYINKIWKTILPIIEDQSI